MSFTLPTPSELNRRHADFWRHETIEAERRSSDHDIRQLAMADLADEQARFVPIRNQKSWEQALRDAEALLQSCQRRLSLRGGKAKKQDALQRFIINIVRGRPKITEKELLLELEKARDVRDVVADIEDGTIHFVDGDRSKEAPISGLKDRLYLAKRTENSR